MNESGAAEVVATPTFARFAESGVVGRKIPGLRISWSPTVVPAVDTNKAPTPAVLVMVPPDPETLMMLMEVE
jgi:hypothetical protein